MCLHEITNREPTPEGIGYKVFYRCYGDALMSPLIMGSDTYSPPYDWVTDQKEAKIRDVERDVCYQTGFHIFKNKEDAEEFRFRMSPHSARYVVTKVSYRQAVVEGTNAVGFENGSYILKPCVVAREMKIEELLERD
jgi:hypothetical protein